MDLYEDLVETYLTVVEGCAVIPQVPILKNRKGEDWSAYPDFLALRFRPQEAQIVEVKKSTGWQAVRELIEKRFAQKEEIEDYILKHTLDQRLDFPFRWRFFIRKVHKSKAEKLILDLGFNAETTDLEFIFSDLARRMP